MEDENSGVLENEETEDVQSAEVPAGSPDQQQTFSEEGGVEAEPAQQDSKDHVAFARMRTENADLRREIDSMRQFFNNYQQMQKQQSQPKEEEIPDDEYLEAGRVKKLINKSIEERVEEKVEELRSELQGIKYMQLEKDVRGRHTDYDNVFELCRKRIEEIPDQPTRESVVNILIQQPNPFEAIYAYGSLHPDYQKKTTTQQTKEMLDNIQKKASQQPTISNVPSARTGDMDYRKRLKNMSDEEFYEELGIS